MRGLALVVAISALCACATQSDSVEEERQETTRLMNDGLMRLVGTPIKSSFSILGFPTQKQDLADLTVYVWKREGADLISVPQVDTVPRWTSVGPAVRGVTRETVVPMTYSCTIKLAADQAGIIRSWEWDGNAPGCSSFAKKLQN